MVDFHWPILIVFTINSCLLNIYFIPSLNLSRRFFNLLIKKLCLWISKNILPFFQFLSWKLIFYYLVYPFIFTLFFKSCMKTHSKLILWLNRRVIVSIKYLPIIRWCTLSQVFIRLFPQVALNLNLFYFLTFGHWIVIIKLWWWCE